MACIGLLYDPAKSHADLMGRGATLDRELGNPKDERMGRPTFHA